MTSSSNFGSILLISPTSPQYIYGENYFFPIGMASISSSLKQAGFSVYCVNTYHLEKMEKSLESKLSLLKADGHNFEFVGIGGMSPMYTNIKRAIEATRNIFPKIKLVLGGSAATCMPELIIKDLKADYAVIGEGEISTVALFKALRDRGDLREVRGIAFWDEKSHKVIVNPPRMEQVDLDALPLPDYDGFGFGEMLDRQIPLSGPLNSVYHEKPRAMILFASRACPFNCTFCYHLPHQKYRQRSVENCFVEIDYMVEKYNINIVYIADEVLFTKNNRDRLLSFCEGLKKRNLLWMCQTMVDAVSDEVLAAMKESGCREISYGIENISAPILKSFRKGMNKEQIEHALAKTYEHGIDIQANLLFGDVEETWDTFIENLVWWMSNRRYCLNLVPVYILPNSKLYLTAKEKGLVTDEIEYLKKGDYNLNITGMSNDDYKKMVRIVNNHYTAFGIYMGITEGYKFTGVDEYGRRRYDIDARCPHCGKLNSYKNFHVRLDNGSKKADEPTRLKCLECTRRYNIGNIDIWADNPGYQQMHLTNYNIDNLKRFYESLTGNLSTANIPHVRVAGWKRRIIKLILALPQKNKKH